MINTYDLKVSHPDVYTQLAVKDILFVYYKCPQVEKQRKLFTTFNEIAFTLSGKRTIHHNNKSWHLTENKSIFFRKTAYKQELDGTAGWEVLAFYFPDEFLRKVFDEYRGYLPVSNIPSPPKDMLIEVKVNETARAFFYGMIPYFKQHPPPPENLLELKFKELLVNLLSEPSNSHLLAYVHSIQDQHKPPLWEVMETNYTFNLTIPQYARMTQRSPSTFKRDFQSYYHTTPGKWLTQKRLDHARLLLETGNIPVSEVAYESGFENISHFSRVFKEKYNVSPGQYRKNRR